MSAGELDTLIERAATTRASKEPVVSEQPPATVQAISSPGWRLHHIPQGCLFSLRHPGHGWVSFVLSPGERAAMLTVMLAQALQPAPVAAEVQPSVPDFGGRAH